MAIQEETNVFSFHFFFNFLSLYSMISHMFIIHRLFQVILQLCQNKENDREQCSEYLPNESSGWKEYGAVRVRITEPTSGIVTLRKVTRTKIEASYSDKTQEVMNCSESYAFLKSHEL